MALRRGSACVFVCLFFFPAFSWVSKRNHLDGQVAIAFLQSLLRSFFLGQVHEQKEEQDKDIHWRSRQELSDILSGFILKHAFSELWRGFHATTRVQELNTLNPSLRHTFTELWRGFHVTTRVQELNTLNPSLRHTFSELWRGFHVTTRASSQVATPKYFELMGSL